MLQTRVVYFVAFLPHVAEHGDQGAHDPHCPSTRAPETGELHLVCYRDKGTDSNSFVQLSTFHEVSTILDRTRLRKLLPLVSKYACEPTTKR